MNAIPLIVPLATDRDIGRYLAVVMKLSDFSQREIARDIGINEATLACMMRGHRRWRLKTLDAVCDYLAVKGETRDRLVDLSRPRRRA